MSRKTLAAYFLCGMALATGVQRVTAQTRIVDVSLNVFPTNSGNPDGGGQWSIVAKTESEFGISAINLYLANIDADSIAMASDVNGARRPGGLLYVIAGPPTNLLYFQDIFEPGVIVGVGTSVTGDGPDPLGNPAWNDATNIFSGTYASLVPAFTVSRGNESDANVFGEGAPPFVSFFDSDFRAIVRGVVRIQAIPEPASAVLATLGLAGLLRRRRQQNGVNCHSVKNSGGRSLRTDRDQSARRLVL